MKQIRISTALHKALKQHCAATDGLTLKAATEAAIKMYLAEQSLQDAGVCDA
jgi:hypothetical protein